MPNDKAASFIKQNWLTIVIVLAAVFILWPIIKGLMGAGKLVGDIISAPADLIAYLSKQGDIARFEMARDAIQNIVAKYAYIKGDKRSENVLYAINNMPVNKFPGVFYNGWKADMIKQFKRTSGKTNVLSQIGTAAGGIGSGISSLFKK